MARYKDYDGIEFPSVTEIIDIVDKSNGLTQWAANLAAEYIKINAEFFSNRKEKVYYLITEEMFEKAKSNFRDVSKEAKSIGSEVHHLIEKYIKAKLIHETLDPTKNDNEYRDEVLNGFLAFLDWEKENQVQWLDSEMAVFCYKHYFAGTLDAVARVNGKITVIDFKTSKGIYDAHKLQISAYAYAFNSMAKNKATHCGILRLDKKTGMPEYTDCTKKVDNRYNAFVKLTDFYYAYKKRMLQNNPRVGESI